jgi:hypothetical protein
MFNSRQYQERLKLENQLRKKTELLKEK